MQSDECLRSDFALQGSPKADRPAQLLACGQAGSVKSPEDSRVISICKSSKYLFQALLNRVLLDRPVSNEYGRSLPNTLEGDVCAETRPDKK